MAEKTSKKKQEVTHVTITRRGVVITCFIVVIVLGLLWVFTPHQTNVTPEYAIATTLQEIDPQTKSKSETIYAVETTVPSSNQSALRVLLNHIKATCSTTTCGIELYDSKQVANEAYLFDTAYIGSEAALLTFDHFHPNITEAGIDAHFIAEYLSSDNTIMTHPLRQNAGTGSPDKTAPANASAKCNDGSYSFNPHASGSCAVHQGVLHWY